jgi:hypothetical protein
MANERMEFMVEDAQIIYRNFAGREGPMNRAGSRNFCVILDPETAEKMAADDWNVRTRDPREEGDEPFFYIPIEVSFKNKPPKVVMITSNARTTLDDDSIEVLDYADIKTADLIAQSYAWTVNGKTGIKAYLKTMFVTINEDELERKYADLVVDDGS